MFYDYYLKTTDEPELWQALLSAGLATVQPDNSITLNAGAALDVIGPITRQIGVDRNGEPVFETLAGFHANLRTDEPVTDTIPSIAPPATPSRVWAGGMNNG